MSVIDANERVDRIAGLGLKCREVSNTEMCQWADLYRLYIGLQPRTCAPVEINGRHNVNRTVSERSWRKSTLGHTNA